MAKLIGTGLDPTGSIVEGQFVDSPANTAEYVEIVEKGYAKPLPPEDQPGATVIEVANAIVRGNDLSANPAAQAIAELFQGAGSNPDEGIDPYTVVHQQDARAQVDTADVEAGPNQTDEEAARVAHQRASGSTLGLDGVGDQALGGDVPQPSSLSDAPAGPAEQGAGDAGDGDEEDASDEDEFTNLRGDDLDKAIKDAGIDPSVGGSNVDGSLSAEEKRVALRNHARAEASA